MLDSAKRALGAYEVRAARLFPVEIGLIHVTFRVEAEGGRFALQRVNPLFGPEVHEDIAAVTEHLANRGLETPRLVNTRDGRLCITRDGEVWRLLTWIDGDNLGRADSPARVRSAGALLGRFHAALQDLEHEFRHGRLGVHDTARHVAGLEQALTTRRAHRLFGKVEPLAQAVLSELDALGPLPDTPERIVHGDPKLNNVIFDRESGEARCLVDLDTFARMPLILELGDAFRSWCNPGGEDHLPPRFEASYFEAALEGYAAGAPGLLIEDERGALVTATATIMLELAARFARDALEESYFGWDAERFSTRGEHNLRRAEVQLELARSLLSARGDAERAVSRRFGGSPGL